ncbi:Serine/threonine protein kinase [Stigmatella erecta]|uniref:Serine/threonine protein kinase n=1 Tax=Stigmatella erecta TaxID=83460 RepID=A0A1I0L6D4_9BACT|nr:Serine/threonine protein kinase [Stigmatella erecta]
MGAWRVLEQRGQGSYGAVYRVEKGGHPEEGPFALKLALHLNDPRFEREGELLSRLQHAGIPRLVERGTWEVQGGGGFPFLVMEWVEGVPLYEWAAQQPLTSRQALKFLAQVASALAATHEAEGVHRDVKGDNILVRTRDAGAVLMDFGSAYYRRARVLTHQFPPPGTPEYQSPESQRFQWEARHQPSARYEAQPADDLYALGVTAYRLVTGRYPPALDMRVTEQGFEFFQPPWIPPETLVSVSPELAEIIQQLLSDEPSGRGTTQEVAEVLEHLARTAGPQADHLITPLPAQSNPVQPLRPQPSRAEAPWLAMTALVYLWLGAWWMNEGHVPAPGKVQQSQTHEQRDGGTVGLGEEVLSSPAPVRLLEPGVGGMLLDIPKKPLPGQRLPPCVKYTVELNGACWVPVRDAVPPCSASMYEWKKACYLPHVDPGRPSTSDAP